MNISETVRDTDIVTNELLLWTINALIKNVISNDFE